jgi:hypothetical protein
MPNSDTKAFLNVSSPPLAEKSSRVPSIDKVVLTDVYEIAYKSATSGNTYATPAF